MDSVIECSVCYGKETARRMNPLANSYHAKALILRK